MANTHRLTLMLSLLFMLNSFPTPSFSCPPHKKQALLDFKSSLIAIISSSPDLDSWNLTSDCCSWERVYCTRTGTITELNLSSLVPPPDINPVPVYSDILTPIFHIRSLERLDIYSNSLLGNIPGDGFGNLTKLVHLDMYGNRFSGSLPSQIFTLVNLRYLDISINLLEGGLGPEISSNSLLAEIPGYGFGNLTQLVHLDMYENRFNGSIPSQIFKLINLNYLGMGLNQLDGELGPELGSLRNLTLLDLERNHFNGSIPRQLFELQSLQYIGLSDNHLEGCLSSEVGTLHNLETLFLKANSLSGKIPEEIGNLTKLELFSLQMNEFSGGIPSSLVNLEKLEVLDLSENLFSGQIPNYIGGFPNMFSLDVSHNKLTGPIPSSMQNLSKLEYLRLHENMLKGDIPTWLFNITTLVALFVGGKEDHLMWNNKAKIVPRCSLSLLSLVNCGISGPIPLWLSSHKDLNLLDLSGNKLDGRFPYWLAAESKVGVLFLSDNKLNGLIPPRLFESVDLYYLDLSRNNFSGEIPVNFPKGIRFLYLGGNKFSGILPRNFTILVNLTILDIHENNITGKFHETFPQIPTLEALILRNNFLEGFIPSNISNLKSLQILDLSHNNLIGSIPREMENLQRMIEVQKKTHFHFSHPAASVSPYDYIGPQDLVVNWKKCLRGLKFENLVFYSLLDLSHNNLFGEIPPSLGNLKAIKQLDISHNKISGHIPESFGNLENIESLDLSHNQISGTIPQSLVNLRQLTGLDLSNNKLTGKIPVGGQMDTMTGFGNNPGLCGMQIQVTCPEDKPLLKGRDEEEDNQSCRLWEGTWVGFPVGFFSSILIMGYFLDFLRLFKVW